MVSGYQNGTIAQLLQAIIGQINFDGEPISNIGDILLSILEQTPYDDEPKSVLAELFLKLKAKLENEPFEPYDKEPQSAIAEILLSILNVTPYEKEPNSRIAELLLELKAKLESYVELTASGSICNFTTSLALPLVSVKSAIVATGGGGTPSNPIAINGFSEAVINNTATNIWNGETESGAFDTTTGEKIANANMLRSINPMPVKPSTTYRRIIDVSYGFRVLYYDKSGQFISSDVSSATSVVFTTPSNCYFINIYYQKAITQVSINYPSTEIGFYDYNPNSTTYTLAFGQTVYGGEVDATNGKVKITHAIVDMGDLPWTYRTEGTNPVFRAQVAGTKQYTTGTLPDIKTTCFEVVNARGATALATYLQDNQCSFISNGSNFTVRCDTYTDVPTFTNAMIGQKLVYELATPIELDITPQEITALVGVNNLWSDTGDSEVVYLAEISDNIEQTSKARAAVKAEKELKAKLEKELKELDEKETIKEPNKEIGETRK